jgi:hypothetical protein
MVQHKYNNKISTVGAQKLFICKFWRFILRCAVHPLYRCHLNSFLWLTTHDRHSQTCAEVTFRNVRRKSQPSRLQQHTGTWSATWPYRHLCFRPEVSFRHLRFVALSFPRELGHAFRNVTCRLLTWNLRNLKLRKSVSVCAGYPWSIDSHKTSASSRTSQGSDAVAARRSGIRAVSRRDAHERDP